VTDYFYGVLRSPARTGQPSGLRPSPPRGVASIGSIARLFVGQCYGFIRLANDREVFFHRTDIRDGTSINDLRVGDPVMFELIEDRISGARALAVRRRCPID
jgi:cold shock CspA family protein